MKIAYNTALDEISQDERNKYLDVIQGRIVKIKYCISCRIYRPPRTVHCGACGCCIERLDHHCPWIGTCVGKRNYKYFIVFMWSIAIICLYAITCCSVHISDTAFNVLYVKESTKGISGPQIFSIILLTLTSGLSIFVFFLFGYHQYLLCRNETTNENLKGTYKTYGNPY